MVVILFILGFIIRNAFFPSVPSVPIGITVENIVSPATATPTSTETLSTSTPIPTETSTSIPPLSTPMFGIGDTMISDKDGMVMIYVPAGEFQMGNEDGDSDEKPVHIVYLDAFWFDQTEITNDMYAKCVGVGSCNLPRSTNSYTRENYYGDSEFDDYPVINISWDDANAYCNWVSRRLPTEAEWEKAASWDEKNQTKYIYPWGDSIDCLQANYWGKVGGCVGDTTAVGIYESSQSPCGAYDMAGNVWEWVADWYNDNYYANSPTTNPQGSSSGSARVLRGGSWSNVSASVSSASRVGEDPAVTIYFFGFRCARDAD